MGDYSFRAVIFDMDGVVTKTALVHAKAWKMTFDEYLKQREKRDGEPFREFTHDGDYLPYVDGKPRYEGVKSFLESRGIDIPFGEKSDTSDKETICGLGNRKNELFQQVLEEEGVERYEPMVEFIKLARGKGIKVGVASSSKNCKMILEKADVLDLFETRVDGVVSEELGLKGKPEADIFITAAKNLGIDPSETVVVEDATSGVAAGRNGGFGLVLGVARKDNVGQLLTGGADMVMKNLSDMNIRWIERWFKRKPLHLFGSWGSITNPTNIQLWELDHDIPIYLNPCYVRTGKEAFFNEKETVFFLDYDGTLTPIVERPELAVISPDMRKTVEKLSSRFKVIIVSGREREDVEKLLGIEGLIYAGSHGFDIRGKGYSLVHPAAEKNIPIVEKVIQELKSELAGIRGLIIEGKKISVAVHYRLVDEKTHLEKIERTVRTVPASYGTLRVMEGKKVFEILPDIDWNKGTAVRWLMEAMELDWQKTGAVYIGDDVTDEYAFRAVRTRGTGVLVSATEQVSDADFRLSGPDEVKELFEKILQAKEQ